MSCGRSGSDSEETYESDRRSPIGSYDDEPSPKRLRRMSHRSSWRKTSAVDRISALPDPMLGHILCSLPIEDAIRTGILSRRWRFLWTQIPSLLFRLRHNNRCRSCYRVGDTRDFITFVDGTLNLYRSNSKLEKFGVDFPFEPDYAPKVNRWAQFAVGKGVEELHLELSNEYYYVSNEYEYTSYELPQLLYTNSSFRALHFSFCNLVPEGLVAWKSLKNLSIGYVNFAKLSDDVIQKILAGSPVLEILELYCFYGLRRLHVSNASVKKLILREMWDPTGEGYHNESVLEISGPNLLSLELLGCLRRMNCRLVDVSSLVDATLNFNLARVVYDGDEDTNNFYETFQNILWGLLESLVRVKRITLGVWAVQVLSIMEAKGFSHSSTLFDCKCLRLDVGWHIKKSVLPAIAGMLERSPELETLVLTMSFGENYENILLAKYFESKLAELCNIDEKHYWTSQNRPFNCLKRHLTEVKVIGFEWDEDDDNKDDKNLLSFAEFLLKNARVLQKLVINEKLPMEVLLKLSSFARLSPNVTVM